MLEAFHSPVAVAVEERTVEERTVEERTVDAVASTFVETEREADAAFADPYDETAPVVAEVAERVVVPEWPSWNGNGTAKTANDVTPAEVSAVAQVETEAPVQAAFMPWDETAPEDPPQFESGPTPEAVMPQTMPESAAPNPPEDLFASPPVSEDELPEPDEVAPWDFDAADEQPALFENPVAEVAAVEFEPMAEAEPESKAEPEARAEPALDAAPAESAQAGEAESFEAWLALAVAGMTDEGSDAEAALEDGR